MKLKGLSFANVTEIQEAVIDELKKFQKEEFSAAFQELYDRTKAQVYMPMELILNKQKVMFLPLVSSIYTKISLKTFEPHYILYRPCK
jgi:predicted secreted protein